MLSEVMTFTAVSYTCTFTNVHASTSDEANKNRSALNCYLTGCIMNYLELLD